MESEHRTIVILNVGQDVSLLSTRHMLLQSAGYIVESTSSIARAFNRLRDGDFDLVVVCHSLSEGERTNLTNSIRETGSAIPVIFVSAGNAPSGHQFRGVSSRSGPSELLQSVEAVLQREIQGGCDIKPMKVNGNQRVLTSWKEIAAYLGKGVRTVQRWEQMFRLPVRRPMNESHKAVLAFPEEIDAWARCGEIPEDSLETERLRAEVERLRQEVERLRSLTPHEVNYSPDSCAMRPRRNQAKAPGVLAPSRYRSAQASPNANTVAS